MTEQQACPLCGAGGHTAAQCSMEMDLIRHIAGLYSGKAIKGDFTQVYITGNEIWMAQQILASQQRAALAQPSPAPELERPEVARWDFDQTGCPEEDCDGGYVASEDFDRIVGALRAEVERSKRTITGMNEAHAKLAGLYEVAQARVAELEQQKPAGYLRVVNGRTELADGPVRPADRSSGYATPWQAIYTRPVAQAGLVPEVCHPGLYAIHFQDNWDGEKDLYYCIADKLPDGRWIRNANGCELIQFEGDKILAAWLLAAAPAQGGA